ncbi:MAG: aminotransferase class I/II-fold pyridoxal phosphate-dependent enzyme [Nakamurella sp.]
MPQLRQAAADSLRAPALPGYLAGPDRRVPGRPPRTGRGARSHRQRRRRSTGVPDPAWPNYEMQAVLLGATVARYTLDPASGFQPDLEQIAQLIGSRTKVLVLNSPSNPTGTGPRTLPAARTPCWKA